MIKLLNTPSFYSALYEVANFCRAHSEEEVVVIVPDKLSLFMEKFIFEHMGISASFNIKVSTLNRFAKKKFVVEKSKQISTIGSVILINKILDEHIAEFEIFKNKAYSFSYAENIFNTINQLKASKITPEDMFGFACKNAQLTSKIHDLQLVYDYYEKEKNGKLDAPDAFLASALFIGNDLKQEKFVFVGFDDFTAIEYSIIEIIAKKCEVNILNYKSNGSNRHIFNAEVYEQLKSIAQQGLIGLEYVDCKTEFNPLKTFLFNNLFGIKNQTFLSEDNFKIFSGNGVDSELEFVAREIKKQVINGQKFANYGVAVYGLEAKINKIKQIFEKYEINCYYDNQFAFNKSVLFKFLQSVLKYYLNGFDIANLLDIINSPFFVAEEAEKQRLSDRLIFFNFGKIDKLILGAEFDDIKAQLVNFLKNFEFGKEEKIKDFVKNFKQIEQNLGFGQILVDLANENVDLTEKNMLTKSRETLLNLLDDICAFYPDANMEKFYDIFMHVANLIKFNNLPLTLDAVKIVDAENCMEIFENLFVVNCTSENAPNFKFDCGIILDAEIEQLNFAHKLAPTIAHINRLAKLRLFNLATMFEKCLTITYSNTQSDLIKELTSKIKVSSNFGQINLPIIYNVGGKNYEALSYWDFVEYNCNNNKNSEVINQNLIKNKQFCNLNGKNLNIFNLKTISASQLENYFKCPFNYFLNNILKIKQRQLGEISSLDVGNIIHEVLHKYYTNKNSISNIKDFCRIELQRYVQKQEHLKLNEASPTIKNLEEELVRIIDGMNYIDQNCLFEPFKFEYEFKGQNGLKLKNVLLEGKIDRIDKFKDFLRIVDYKSGIADASLKELYYGNKLQLFLYALAMDNHFDKKVVGEFYLPLHNEYKKELSNTYSLKGFYVNDFEILQALDKRIEETRSSDIVNLNLTNSNLAAKHGKQLAANEMDKLKNYAKQVSENAVEEIKQGYIAANPNNDSKICVYCPYVQICMQATNNINKREAQTIKLESFDIGGKDEKF